MSYLTGALSGALIAGSVYYGFSNSIRTSLAHLTTLLTHPPPLPPSAAPPASSRIVHHDFTSTVKGQWNEHIDSFFRAGVERWEWVVSDWGRRVFFGGVVGEDAEIAKTIVSEEKHNSGS